MRGSNCNDFTWKILLVFWTGGVLWKVAALQEVVARRDLTVLHSSTLPLIILRGQVVFSLTY